jgi:diguanylate cyclase (GGDEF)-like protein
VGRVTEAFNRMADQLLEDHHQRAEIERALQESLHQASERAEELELRSRESELLGRLLELFQSSTGLEEAWTLLGPFCSRLFPNARGALYLLASSRNMLECVASFGDQPFGQVFGPDDCMALRLGRAHQVDQSEPELLCKHSPVGFAGETLCVPLIAQGETLGILHVAAPKVADKLVRSVAEQLSLAMANLRLRETLRQQSIRDPLTGLFNRRFLEESLDRELARARRNRDVLAILMVDVDHFKHFNDTFGHEAGDLVLQSVGRFLREGVRQEDVACRYGGEEFSLLLPGMQPDLAFARAERLRIGIEGLRIQFGSQLLGPITASFGMAMFPDNGNEPGYLFQQADAALYRAKKEGRNRVLRAPAVDPVRDLG